MLESGEGNPVTEGVEYAIRMLSSPSTLGTRPGLKTQLYLLETEWLLIVEWVCFLASDSKLSWVAKWLIKKRLLAQIINMHDMQYL